MTFELVITRNCNLNCKYCFEGKKTNEVMEEQSIPNILNFIDLYKNNDFIFDKDNIHIDFNGGEALLNKDFITNFIKSSKDRNFSYSVTTNGICITDDFVDFIYKNDISVQISLDGDKETNDKNRRFYDGQGSFDIVYNNLLKLRNNLHKEKLSISLVVTPDTVSKLFQNIKFLLDNGFTSISASYCIDYVWDDTSLKIYSNELKKLNDLYIEFLTNNKVVNISLISQQIQNILNNFSKPNCGACIDMLAILPNGNILPCGGFVGCKNEDDIVIGNIKESIQKDKIKEYLNNPSKFDKDCNICSLSPRCHHSCYANNNRVTGDKHKICSSYCKLNQITIMNADHILNTLLKTKNQFFYETFLRRIYEKKDITIINF